jgi:2,3-dihydroxybenzoate decarboxylase
MAKATIAIVCGFGWAVFGRRRRIFNVSRVEKASYKRIATEEAFATAEQFRVYQRMLDSGRVDPGFNSLWGFYLNSPSERPATIRRKLLDLDAERIFDMDDTGIDLQILSLTAPGVNALEADKARSLSVSSNDELAEAVQRHSSRFAGLAAFAPQDPAHAAKEIERGVRKLGFKGAILNAHCRNEYLDDPKFWAIFEAAEALDVPVYLHPAGPSNGLIQPLLEKGLDGAIFGFGVDTGLHALRLIVSGVFDRFPRLKLVLGHLGEALPFWSFRLDYMHRATVAAKRYETLKPLKRRVTDYLRENLFVTTSGMACPATILYCREMLGADHVLYAMDYPYQFVAEEVIAQDDLALGAAEKAAFFQHNAEKLFRL